MISNLIFIITCFALATSALGTQLPSEKPTQSKSWSKEELFHSKSPPKVQSLGDVAYARVSSFMQELTARKHSPQDQLLLWQQEKQEEWDRWMLSHATTQRSTPFEQNIDSRQILEHLKSESQTIATRRLKNLEEIRHLTKGLHFKLHLGSKKTPSPPPPPPATLRYGLILQGFIEEHPGNFQAANNQSWEQQIQFAGKAEPIWTIGPIEEKPMNLYKPIDQDLEKSNSWTWYSIPWPEPNFDIKLHSDKSAIDETAEPNRASGLIFEFFQEDRYYGYARSFGSQEEGQEELERHTLSMPIWKKVQLSRRFDGAFDLKETGLRNISLSKHSHSALMWQHDSESVIQKTTYAHNAHHLHLSTQSSLANLSKINTIHQANYSISYSLNF
jgi:hypothetical protein